MREMQSFGYGERMEGVHLIFNKTVVVICKYVWHSGMFYAFVFIEGNKMHF